MAPGVQPFTFLTLGKETTSGTPVATTRELYPDGTGFFTPEIMQSFHEGANRGLRTNITHATKTGVGAQIPFRTAPDVGASYDDLILAFTNLVASGGTATGGSADKTWTFTSVQGAVYTPNTFTIEVGDDAQAWEVEYCFATGFSLSSDGTELTQMSIDWVGRQSTKTTATSVSGNNAVKIPAKTWTLQHASAQSGLAAAGTADNLAGWTLTVDTGLRPRRTQKGQYYFTDLVASGNLSGTLEFDIHGDSSAVSEYWDKAAAQTLTFARLKNTGPSLGSSNYSAQIDVGLLYEVPEPIAAEDEGVNIWRVRGRIAYDSTWTNSLVATVVNSLATLP